MNLLPHINSGTTTTASQLIEALTCDRLYSLNAYNRTFVSS